MLFVGLLIGIPILLVAAALTPAILLQRFLHMAGDLQEEPTIETRESPAYRPALLKA